MDDDLETELKKLSTATQSTENKIFQYSNEYSTQYILNIADIIKKFQININNLYCDGNQIKFCNDNKSINDDYYKNNFEFIKKTIYDLYNKNKVKDNIDIKELYSITEKNITTINFIYCLFNDLCFDILKIIKSYENLCNKIKKIDDDGAAQFLSNRISELPDTFKTENKSKLDWIKNNYKNILIPQKYFKILSYFKDDLKIFIGQDIIEVSKLKVSSSSGNNMYAQNIVISSSTENALNEFLKIIRLFNFYSESEYTSYIWNVSYDSGKGPTIDVGVRKSINDFLININSYNLDENIKFEYNYFPVLFDELKKYRALLSIINNIICGKIEFLMSILNNNETIKLKPFIITESHIVNISKDSILYTKKEIFENPLIINDKGKG